MPWKRVILTSFALLAATSGVGCKKLVRRGADAGVTTSDDAGALQQEAAADEQVRAKLNNYVDCINALSNPVLKSRDKLNSYFPNGTITGKELFAEVPKLAPEAAPTCMLHATMGRSLPPSNPALEQSGMEFADAAASADELTRRMAAYLESRAYKKDKWAKGKDLYPQLLRSWERFAAADDALHIAIASVSGPLEERALARIERQDGRKFLWHRKHTVIAARALMDASDPVGSDAPGGPAEKSVDLAAFTQSHGDFEKALDELVAYGNEHKADLSNPAVSENHSVADANFRTFVSRATELKRAASHYGRCLREAPEKARKPNGKIDRARVGTCSDGTSVWTRSDDLIAKFNVFIGAFNNLPFP